MKKIFGAIVFMALTFVFIATSAYAEKKYSIKEVLECQIDSKERAVIAKNFNNEMKKRGVPLKNDKGRSLNKQLVLNYCITAYGASYDGPGDKPFYRNGKRVYRYNGRSMGDLQVPNFFYPDDTKGITADYTKIIKFRSHPWNYKKGINTGRKPRVLWGDPRWKNKNQIKLNDAKRVTELGRALDMNYVMKANDLNNPQKYLLTKNAFGTYFIKNEKGTELSKYANILEYPGKFTAGTFVMYRLRSDGIYFYSIYMLPPKEPIFKKPELDDLYIKDFISSTPTLPKANDKISIKIKVGNSSPNDKTYKNVSLKFGWKDLNQYWCTTVPKIEPGKEVTVVLDSKQKKLCSGKKETFTFPEISSEYAFFAEINHDKKNPVKEKTFTNNKLTKYIKGQKDKIVKIKSINCSDDSRFCIESFPTYPSTNTEGGKGTYFKVRYDFKTEKKENYNIVPKEIVTEYKLYDPKNKVIVTGVTKKTIPNSCFKGINLKNTQACSAQNYFVGNAEFIFSKVPENKRIHFKNVGNYKIEFIAKENRVIRRLDENGKVKETKTSELHETVIVPFKVTGVSSGKGDF